MRKEKGITLIALIITIIIMLILAGIVINLTIGENGLFKTAKTAAREYEIASIKEQIMTDIYSKQAENMGNMSEDSLKKVLEKYGTLSEEENIMDKTLTTDKGNYEIKVSDLFNGTTIKDPQKPGENPPENPVFTKVANAPSMDAFDKTQTYYVAWNLNTSETEYVPNERKVSENVAPNNWYDYTEGINHWANIKTVGGGNECYWVWIPRYAYRVPTKGSTAETIEVKFLKGTSNVPIGETEAITNTTPNPGLWVVHPAFTNVGNGGFGELDGIWVAKFEASSDLASVVENPTASQLGNNGGGSRRDLKVRVKPNVISWRGISLGEAFTACRNLTVNGNSLEGSTGIESHMIKNTEWGAVAYLSSSKYGKTDSYGNRNKVWNNPYYYDSTYQSSITGLCGKGENKENLKTTNLGDTCKYNEIGGGNASTTGNVYGVYDMSGGSLEYVAGMLESHKKDDKGYYDFSDSSMSKYFDWYAGSSSDFKNDINYKANTTKYGDAVYETSSSGYSSTGSWDSSMALFLYYDYNVVFVRGGGSSEGRSSCSIFAFNASQGEGLNNQTFRPVLIENQGE